MRILLLLLALALLARPRYGGTLVIDLQDPAPTLAPASTHPRLANLIYDRLVSLDSNNQPAPALAVSWANENNFRRWQFRLRTNARAHDGTVLTPALVAAAISLPNRTVTSTPDSILIQSAQPQRALLYELARFPIALRGNGALTGTGPFRVLEFDPNRKAVLVAFEGHWAGRPFIDTVEVHLARPNRLAELEGGRSDIAELPLAEARRQLTRGRKAWAGFPLHLILLEFARTHPAVADPRLRQALALAVDRAPILNVLLQRQGESTAALLPQLVSGYAALFATSRDLARAGTLLPPPAAPILLGHDAADPSLRLLAERIALNAREANLPVRVVTGPADATLLRIAGSTLVPADLLAEYCSRLGIAAPAPSFTFESLLEAEKRALDGGWLLPLFHVPPHFGVGARVRNFVPDGALEWRIDQTWIEAAP